MKNYDPNGYTSRQQVLDALENHRNGVRVDKKEEKTGKSAKEGKTPRKSSPTKSEETK